MLRGNPLADWTMLQAIELTNFKCYEALDLPCSALTVLTGYNAASKSTVLQALLFLAQGLRTAASEKELPLNGELVRVGSEGDVRHHGAIDPSFTLGVRSADERIRWTFGWQKARPGSSFVPPRAFGVKAGVWKRHYQSARAAADLARIWRDQVATSVPSIDKDGYDDVC